jgi:hypothetical protein
MANEEHVAILEQGVEFWNKWRKAKSDVLPNLSDEHFNYANLRGADLSLADLSRTKLNHADLRSAYLMGAKLNYAELRRANLRGASLVAAKLNHASLIGAKLEFVNFRFANLEEADFSSAKVSYTQFDDVDLSGARGLESLDHFGPSEISISTLYKSHGKIPERFLWRCGVPDDFIAFIPSHFGIQQAIQFYSCFISYSTKDEEFAKRLHSRMRDNHMRVWFAPEDIKGGQKIHEQLERAIQVHDRLLIVLSESSLNSKWVRNEIVRARKIEIKENRRKLFPIRLVDYETIQAWEYFDADYGEDLAAEIRQYHIPDFSNWKEHDSFEDGFNRLMRDLKAEGSN